MNESIPDAVEEPPWNEADGPEPEMHIYPRHRQPGLYIRHKNQWHRATVTSRDTHHDGHVTYHVDIAFEGKSGYGRAYRWGQPGVRYAYGPDQGRLPDD
ncbi:hypothetical protein [Streptomyces parvus]|uniref:hypothetical protein n=1 Tax=Streptomyces parvus TaxID=66428 RepID=UPI0033275DEF